MSDSHRSTKLRRTLLGGYRVADIEALEAEFGSEISGLRSELQSWIAQLAEANASRQELEAALAEAAAAKRAEFERERTAAQAEAQRIVDEAQLVAARLRSDAALEADTARSQVDELLRVRDTLMATMRLIVHDFERVAGQIERGEAPVLYTPASAAPTSAAPASAPVAAPSSANGHGTELFTGRVELEAGPFVDFASLSAFERALGSLPKIEDVYIRRFEDDLATIDITLLEPASLADEMAAHMPYRLDVTSADAEHLAVTVAEGGKRA